MKRGTQLKIMAGVVALGLSVGYVASSPINYYLGSELQAPVPVREAVTNVVAYAYDNQVKVDDRFVNAYLQTIKSVYLDPDECLIGDYNADSVMFYQNERWQFYEWIPSLEEVEANMEDTKPLVLTINQ